jgi:hypothetical protein
MLGDARAAGKRHSTRKHGPEYKAKNSHGRSHKHIAPAGHAGRDSGGEQEMGGPAAHATHGHRPGTHVADRQAPHKQRERKEVKHVDQGMILDEWCAGKRRSYR